MSVTFSVANSPTVTRTDDYGDSWEEDVWPSYNVANVSAGRILAMVGLDPTDLCGEITPKQAREVLRRALRVRNMASLREPYTTDDHLISEPSGARVYVQGVDDERVVRWLNGFIAVVHAAIEHDQPVLYG